MKPELWLRIHTFNICYNLILLTCSGNYPNNGLTSSGYKNNNKSHLFMMLFFLLCRRISIDSLSCISSLPFPETVCVCVCLYNSFLLFSVSSSSLHSFPLTLTVPLIFLTIWSVSCLPFKLASIFIKRLHSA